MLLTELVTKELEIMKQTLPHMTPVGVLLTVTAPSHRPASQAVETAAKQLVFRAEGRVERLPELAAELVGLNVDIIVTLGGVA